MAQYAPNDRGTGKYAKPQKASKNSCVFCDGDTMQLIRIKQIHKCQACGTEKNTDQKFPFISLADMKEAEKAKNTKE